ncbi:histidine kinase [Nonomuraea sp. LP-02]|uniref:sensor histidine kinase n=1 Tax=Nonomuraea sp. LP-02 TaxID=3097960 RepID=UPI002E2EC911|nr:histidine kinase [Nonomuraea sp. LP-02]MED7926527.1 histidine kinase [Nonomuraea sp. LP-02]
MDETSDTVSSKNRGPFFARRLRRGQLVMLDLVAGIVIAFVFLTSAAAAAHLPPWAKIALPLGLGLPLALRRVWPMPVFLFTLALAVIAQITGAVTFSYFAPAYALYVVALNERAGSLVPVSAIGSLSLLTVAGLVVAGTPQAVPSWVVNLDEPLMGIAALGGAWTIGRAVYERRLYAARNAERLAAQAVTQERLRIARELHDVVTHNVGLIAVKAGVANHVIATRPEEARDALRVIETASRGALIEMRHLLGMLRSTSDAADRTPAPGLAGLDGLVRQARSAGIEVQFETRFHVATGKRGVMGSRGEDQDDSDGKHVGGEHLDARGASGRDAAGRDNDDRGVERRNGIDGIDRGGTHGNGTGGKGTGGKGTGGNGTGGNGMSGATADGSVTEGITAHGAGGDGAGVDGGRAEGVRGNGAPVRPAASGPATFGTGADGVAVGGAAVSGDASGGGGIGDHGVGGGGIGGMSAAAGSSAARLPEGIELAVYRIVQEALTNVIKHAAPARCRVSVLGDGRDVRIEVVDDGPGRRTLPSAGAGHGLIGMRERVMMYGGAFEAEGLPGRGFRVFARLPYGEEVT